MGEVWRARDTRLAREVAVKVLPAEVASDASRLKRFEKEARAASALNHPNIVTIHDIGSADSVSYIAMELVSGKTLREVLFNGPLPIKKLLSMAAQIADGLGRAHEAGITHRDLKPENLMVTKDGLVKILDFGLAKLTQADTGSGEGSHLPTETGTSPGMVLGTVGYMSPEQASGGLVDFRSDQFSFGSILYEMATGKRAFQKGTAVDTLSAILHEEPKAVAQINPEAPAPLRWIVERCLAKEPEGRYASTRDLARELATVRDHLSEASSAVGVLEPAKAAPRLGRLRIAALAALAIAAVAVLSHLLWAPPKPATPTFRRVTFRDGNIVGARFAPDGRSVFYDASFDGQPYEIYTTRPEGPESIPIGLKSANFFSVSRSGDLAVRLLREGANVTLATVPMGGGAPRPIAEFVEEADWTPDGKQLAVLRSVERRNRIELPLGKVIYATGFEIVRPRISPQGDQIGFYEATARGWSIRTVDLAGKSKTQIESKMLGDGVAWAPNGKEIWFDEFGERGQFFVRAVDLEGRVRTIFSSPVHLAVRDISRDGRVLVERFVGYWGIIGLAPGETVERELSWFGESIPKGLSDDGRTLLLDGSGGATGHAGDFYLRKTDGSPAVRLGEGSAIELSADGKWVLTRAPDSEKDLVLVPAGTGAPVALEELGFERVEAATLFPDGKRILLAAAEPGRKPRLYVQELPSGKARPITERTFGITGKPISPAGDWIVARGDSADDLFLVPTDGGEPRTIPGTKDLTPIRWTPNGRFLFARVQQGVPARVVRVEVATGKRERWTDLALSGPSGSPAINRVYLTPDGTSYVYGYTRAQTSDLYVVEGLK